MSILLRPLLLRPLLSFPNLYYANFKNTFQVRVKVFLAIEPGIFDTSAERQILVFDLEEDKGPVQKGLYDRGFGTNSVAARKRV